MPTIDTSADIEAPAAVVFALAQDYDLRLAWDSFLREIRFDDGARAAAVGVRATVKARNGIGMTVEYVTFEPPHRVAVRMVSRSRLFERFAGTWSFEPIAPARTRVVFRYGFETRSRALRPLLDPVIAWRLTREMRKRVAGLKRAVEQCPSRS
jgi:ribosome-associated toxin RatA of RatAB toxin-antitoxin module